MRFLGVIPARGGSKGIPKKNSKLLAGKPLISYTIEAAQNANLDHLIVSTDDPDIIKISQSFGVSVVERPAVLGQDHTPTLPVIQNVLEKCAETFDAVVLLQPTSPFRTSEHIRQAVNLFEQSKSADSLVSVVKVPHNMTPESIMIEESGTLKPYINTTSSVLRRQDKGVYWARNGAAIYISTIDVLKSSILGQEILPFYMSKTESLDIDDMEDWRLAEIILNAEKKHGSISTSN